MDENTRFHGRNVEKKNTSFLLGMQFEAEKNAIGKKTVGAPHLAKHHFCKGGLS